MKAKESVLAYALCAAIVLAPLVGCSSIATESADSSQAEASATATSTSDSDGDEQYILYLGTNDKDTNEPVYSREESMERAKDILMEHFGGYTIQEAEGGWKGDDGTEYQEYTLVIHLSDTNLEAVHDAAKVMIKEFHQSSVLINTEHVQTEFYDGK